MPQRTLHHHRAHLGRCFVVASLGIILTVPPTQSQEKQAAPKLDPSLVALDSDEGRRLLEESNAKESYVSLSMYFETQRTTTYCGVASACMVLNASGVKRPASMAHDGYPLFTQINLFDTGVAKVITAEDVARSGMCLETLGELFKSFPLDVKVVFADRADLDSFRTAALKALKSRNSYVVANYLRSAIKQERFGHISTIAAYHKGEDRFLILDVAKYKYPPVWVKGEDLWKAMCAVDGSSKRSRGFVIVSPESK